jgi:hypothetical protein
MDRYSRTVRVRFEGGNLNKKLPAILGLVLVLIGAFVGVLFINQDTGFLPRAAPEYIPQNVRITNPTDSSFTISWVTQEPAVGFIKLGLDSDNLDTTIVDIRDQLTGSSSQFRTHLVTVSGLEASTIYYFRLGSQDNKLYDNDGAAYTHQTGPTLTGNPPSDTAYGTILTPAQTPASGALVYISLENTAPLASIVREDGSWAVNLSQARTANLQNFADYDSQTSMIQILVQDAVASQTLVTTTAGNDQPVPDIVIGSPQDHSGGSNSNPPDSSPAQISKFSLVPIVVTDPENSPIEITTFPQDGVVTGLNAPVIEGTAPAGSILTLTLQSAPVYTAAIQSDTDGAWVWTPPNPLTPGEHTLTVTYTDENGKVHTLTRSFVVASSDTGNLPSYTATPSATLTPTSSPTAATTPKPTSISTPTPIIRSSLPATDSGIPTAGNSTPTLMLLFVGLVIVTLGLVVSFKTNRYDR